VNDPASFKFRPNVNNKNQVGIYIDFSSLEDMLQESFFALFLPHLIQKY
jgi:hypothetical protein